jgi:hypothetical protein
MLEHFIENIQINNMNQLDINQMQRLKEKYKRLFKNQKILELGSLDMNGSVWDLFENCEMTGVDWVAGPHVTHVMKCSDTEFKPETFAFIISLNHMEHDPYWEQSLKHNIPALMVGGMMFLKWCSTHSSKHCAEYDPSGKLGYYPKELNEVMNFFNVNYREFRLKAIDKGTEHNPSIGMMAYILLEKRRND